ncbi:MAG: hypothetical protein J0H74_00250 [Chitinophagaceae bacterium]|nr:hypothetical protein [Chitinophagaceae bacterium]
MRNATITIATMLLSGALSAQGVFSNKTQSVLEKVIQDYPNHFHNIRGELISQAQKMAEYKSTLQLPGSPSSMVVLTGNTGAAASEGYSWTCTVLETESFDKARERFHNIYGELSNSIITLGTQKTFILNGQYEDPVPDKKPARVVFSLLPGVGDLKRLRVELLLRQEDKGYKILLSVNDHDPMLGAITLD